MAPEHRMIHIHQLCLSPGHNFFGHHQQPPGNHPTLEVDQIECAAGQGIHGDRYFGFKENYKGQITFFSLDVFDALRRELNLPAAQASATRRNVFVRGLDLNTLIGAEFEIQGVRFAGIEECRPCHWMNYAVGPGAEAWLKGRGGLRAKILTCGILHREAEIANLTAIILAGGQSQRMDCDKATLELEGQTLLGRAVIRLRELDLREIFISGRAGRDDTALGCPILLDHTPGLGPVAGIERGLQAANKPLVLVWAVDLPQVTLAFLRKLMSNSSSSMGVVPEWNGALEPLAAIYPKTCHGMSSAFLAEGRRAARDFAEICVRKQAVKIWPLEPDDARCLANWNTLEDAQTTGVTSLSVPRPRSPKT